MGTAHGNAALRDGWKRLSAQGVRRRDAAASLGVTEAELLAAHLGTEWLRPLRPEWTAILKRVPSLGDVMALTRNDACVIEKIGTYGAPQFVNEHLGQVTGQDIDLRLFLRGWAYGFAVTQDDRASLEFYGPDGKAVHKIVVREATDRNAFEELVGAFAIDAPRSVTVMPSPVAAERSDDEIDVGAYRAALAAMNDTHEFFGVMRRFGLTREQALRLGGAVFAKRIEPTAYRALLITAAQRGVPIMAFVGNEGVIQIHTGRVHRVVEQFGYFNVLDIRFNLHLLEERVARAWTVRKPTKDGIISSVELFDASGNLIVQFFGERHGGETERPDWRALLAPLRPHGDGA